MSVATGRSWARWLASGLMLLSLGGAARPPDLALWRLDCGAFVSKHLTDSCYLIRHHDRWMLWDVGLDESLLGKTLTQPTGATLTLHETLASQLALLGLTPDRIQIVGLSHVHFDHIGQASAFPGATLMVGRQDWDKIVSMPVDAAERGRLQPWLSGGSPKALIEGDRDVFGDGLVVMLATPGHTPGHHSLLVRLHHMGPIMLTGDLYDTAARYAQRAPKPHEEDRDAAIVSMRRFDDLVRTLHATVIIQHEPQDVAKLPPFPKAAT